MNQQKNVDEYLSENDLYSLKTIPFNCNLSNSDCSMRFFVMDFTSVGKKLLNTAYSRLTMPVIRFQALIPAINTNSETPVIFLLMITEATTATIVQDMIQ